MNTIYLIHISPQFMSPKFTLPPKAKKPLSILLKDLKCPYEYVIAERAVSSYKLNLT